MLSYQKFTFKTLIGAELALQIGKELLRCLQPTAAIGGSPRDKALALIKGVESFNRGFTRVAGLIARIIQRFSVNSYLLSKLK